jgi:hypothetical protein
MRTKFKPFRDGSVGNILSRRPSGQTRWLLDAEMSVLAGLVFKSSLKKSTQLPNVITSETSDQDSRSEKKELGGILSCPHHGKAGQLSPETTLPYSKQLFEEGSGFFDRRIVLPAATNSAFNRGARVSNLFTAASGVIWTDERGLNSSLSRIQQEATERC